MKKTISILLLFLTICLKPEVYATNVVAYTSGTRPTKHDIIARLKRIAAKHPDGFTVYITTLKPVKKGWCVGMLETQNSFGDTGLHKALRVAQQTTKVLGGWKNGKLFYWDAVMLFNNRQLAIKAGIKNRQISIYNIETGKSIELKVIHQTVSH